MPRPCRPWDGQLWRSWCGRLGVMMLLAASMSGARLAQGRTRPAAARRLLNHDAPDHTFTAEDVEELTKLLKDFGTTPSEIAIDLDPTHWYNFTAANPSIIVPASTNVTIDCHGTWLVECMDCPEGSLTRLGQSSFLEFVDCHVLTNHHLVPVSAWSATETAVQPLKNAPAIPPEGQLMFTKSEIVESDCAVVSFLEHLVGAGLGAIVLRSVGSTKADITVAHLVASSGLPSYEVLSSTVSCEDVILDDGLDNGSASSGESSSTSKKSSPVLGIVAGVAVTLLAVITIVVAVVCLRRRKAKQAVTKEGALQESFVFDCGWVKCCATSATTLNGSDKVSRLGVEAVPMNSQSTMRGSDSAQSSLGPSVPGTNSSRSPRRDKQTAEVIASAIREVKDELQVEELHIHGVIARGGFGTVYRGTWKGLHVAVKTVMVTEESESSMQRVANETAVAYNLHHRNIVPTYSHQLKRVADSYAHELGTYKLYLVQELSNGGTLDSLVSSGVLRSRSGGPHLPRVLSLLLDIARGMAHVHSQRIVHGDLNPNNVLLFADKESRSKTRWQVSKEQLAGFLDEGLCTAKITDFGLSIRLSHDAPHISGILQGTPFYCAPELANKHRLGPESDVYSYGVMLWSLAHGLPPFQVSKHGVQSWHPNFPAFQKSVPLTYTLLAIACLSKEPHERPSFGQIMDVLKALQSEMGSGRYVDTQGREQASMSLGYAAPGTHQALHSPTPKERTSQSKQAKLQFSKCSSVPTDILQSRPAETPSDIGGSVVGVALDMCTSDNPVARWCTVDEIYKCAGTSLANSSAMSSALQGSAAMAYLSSALGLKAAVDPWQAKPWPDAAPSFTPPNSTHTPHAVTPPPSSCTPLVPQNSVYTSPDSSP